MASFTAGTTFTDGVANDVTAAKLGALVSNATPTSGLIQDRTTETVVATNDTLLIGDASDSNNLKRMTVANMLKAPIVTTSGTIDNLTTGTTTSTAEIVTSGTIATLNSTTGTIANFVSTTGTVATLNSTTGTITTGVIPTLTSTTLITTGTGTAAAPAIVPTGDTDTGIFFPAADTIAFSEGGAEAVRIDSSGNVGIGNTSPSSFYSGTRQLVVGSGSGEQGITIYGGNASASFLTFADGTTGDQAYRGTVKYDHAADAMMFQTGAGERLRIDSSGRVGIGTVDPINKLHLYNGIGSVGATQLELEGLYNGYGAGINFSSRTSSGGTLVSMAKITADAESAFDTTPSTQDSRLAFSTTLDGTLTERLRIDSSGNVGIGTASPAYKLDVSGDIGVGAGNKFTTVSGNDLNIDAPSTRSIFLKIAGSTKATIDSSGQVGIGTSSPTATLHSVSASASTAAGIFQVTATSGTSLSAVSVIKQDALSTTNQNFVLFQVNGGLTSSGKINANGANAAAFGSTSDSRLKENITALPSQLDNVCALKPCEFDYKDGSGHQIGFIAQEMQQIYPDSVGVGDDGMLTITAWSKTEARLVKAIQELKAKNDSLEARLQVLESK